MEKSTFRRVMDDMAGRHTIVSIEFAATREGLDALWLVFEAVSDRNNDALVVHSQFNRFESMLRTCKKNPAAFYDMSQAERTFYFQGFATVCSTLCDLIAEGIERARNLDPGEETIPPPSIH